MSAMSFRPRAGRKEVTLSVISLVDVLFLLIIFFMLTGTFKRSGELELRLPDSTTANAPAQGVSEHQIELVATDEGTLLLDGEPVDLSSLPARLAEARRKDPESQVMIKAEAEVHHGAVVALLDVVRGSGFPGVGIGTYVRSTPEVTKKSTETPE